MTSYVNSYVEKTNLLRALLGDVRNQPIKRLMADVIYKAINSYSTEKEEEKIIKTGRKTGPTTLRLRIHEVGPSPGARCTSLHVAWPAP